MRGSALGGAARFVARLRPAADRRTRLPTLDPRHPRDPPFRTRRRRHVRRADEQLDAGMAAQVAPPPRAQPQTHRAATAPPDACTSRARGGARTPRVRRPPAPSARSRPRPAPSSRARRRSGTRSAPAPDRRAGSSPSPGNETTGGSTNGGLTTSQSHNASTTPSSRASALTVRRLRSPAPASTTSVAEASSTRAVAAPADVAGDEEQAGEEREPKSRHSAQRSSTDRR